jgi:hypothetical protein
MSHWKTSAAQSVDRIAFEEGIPTDHVRRMKEHFARLRDKDYPTQGDGVERIRHHGDGSWYRQAIKDEPELAVYRSIFKRYNYNDEARKATNLNGVLRLFAIFRRSDDLYETRVATLINEIDG